MVLMGHPTFESSRLVTYSRWWTGVNTAVKQKHSWNFSTSHFATFENQVIPSVSSVGVAVSQTLAKLCSSSDLYPKDWNLFNLLQSSIFCRSFNTIINWFPDKNGQKSTISQPYSTTLKASSGRFKRSCIVMIVNDCCMLTVSVTISASVLCRLAVWTCQRWRSYTCPKLPWRMQESTLVWLEIQSDSLTSPPGSQSSQVKNKLKATRFSTENYLLDCLNDFDL